MFRAILQTLCGTSPAPSLFLTHEDLLERLKLFGEHDSEILRAEAEMAMAPTYLLKWLDMKKSYLSGGGRKDL